MYHLPQHVFFCFTGSHCVFLDVERDQYLAVNRESVESLAPWLSSYSHINEHLPPEQIMPSTAAATADELLTHGLLTNGQLDGKPFQSVRAATLRSTHVPKQSLVINAARFTVFYAACRAADKNLTAARARDTIELVRRRKNNRSGRKPADPAYLLSLLSTFNTLRPIYPRPYLCLFDSLALVEFLARYRVFPTWVFGVCGEPFQAHCWVQHEGLLLDDSVDHVATFTPIMTV